MKGVLASVCALAIVGQVISTFPNDLYYHHHPDLAVADARKMRFGASNSRGHHRNAYTNGRHAYEYTERRPYKASYGHDDRESKLVYNEDGSINWEKTKGKKSHKMAASDTSGYFGGPGSNSFPLGDFTPNRQTYSDDYDDDDDYEDGYYDRRRSNYAGGIRLAGAVEDDGYTHAEGTFYDVETHIGTCGKQSQNSDKVCALNAEDMGEGGSENEKCGKSIEVVGPSGKTVTVTVVDSCKTCKAGGLDLSPAAYEELGEFSHGSIPIKWKYT